MAEMKAPRSGVRVRMYNPGFGDCFLLAFRGKDGKPVYVLIDCGVHGQYKGGSDRIRAVLRDVRAATGGHIHLAVVTHEHADHVSGFYLGRGIFSGDGDPLGGIEVDEVWFAWTEDPRSAKARRLDRVKKLLLQGLLGAPRSLNADEEGSMLGFYAMEGEGASQGGANLPLGGSALGVSTREAREALRRHAGKSTYLKPKQPPLAIPGVDQVRVFVLGPPEDEAALLSADPTGEEGEVYEGEGEDEDGHAFRFGAEEALVAALGASGRVPGGAGDPPPDERYQPFGADHRLHRDKVRARPDLFCFDFFHRHYGFEPAASTGSTEPGSAAAGENAVDWRRIDDEWLNGAESLALKLDSATNNTSLVLAFELEGSRRVLLFPGDAQVGNWKSWHDGGWTHANGLAQGEEVTAADLLERTVLYKVGHHGSHNATLRRQGLELMTSDELIALIPVDEVWAHARKPHAWKMPFVPIYEDLKVRTKGRLVRTDQGVYRPQGGTKKERDRAIAEIDAAWKQFPGRKPKENELYAELEIPDR